MKKKPYVSGRSFSCQDFVRRASYKLRLQFMGATVVLESVPYCARLTSRDLKFLQDKQPTLPRARENLRNVFFQPSRLQSPGRRNGGHFVSASIQLIGT
jgi:hypothetical protein